MKLNTKFSYPSVLNNQHRKYHIYGIASNYLKVAHHQMIEKEMLLKTQKENLFMFEGKSITPLNKFVKRTRSAPIIKQVSDMEQTIEACIRIQRLCEEAYELGKNVREKKHRMDYPLSDELYDFICLTNESYPCLIRSDFEIIQMFYKIKSQNN
jgi:hypothetical protein